MSTTVVSWEGRSREQGMARALDRLRRSEVARPGKGGVGSVGEGP